MNETYSVTQFSEMLGISPHNVRNYIKRGELKANKENEIYSIPRAEYEKFALNYQEHKSVNVNVVLKRF